MDKVRVVPPTQALKAPAVAPEIPHTVNEALLHDRQVEVLYQKRGASQAASYTVNPLGLVQRGLITHLVCTLFRYSDVILLAAHRIQQASLREDPAHCPKGFDLDDYLESGAAHFGDGKDIKLVVLFRSEAGDHLLEAPLSNDQVVSDAGNGWMRVKATVQDTPQLRWWLQGFGDQVRVEKHKNLRDAMVDSIEGLRRYYNSNESHSEN